MRILEWFAIVLALQLFFHSEACTQSVTILDTVYTPPGYVDGPLTATIFKPHPSTAKGIGVVLARYTFATRLTARIWCDTLAARGYVAMTIDYGNLDTSYYPKPQRAFKTAVEFLRRNADRFGITTGKIVGLGQSQGTHVWGQTIIWDNDDSYFGTDTAVDDHLDAAILLYGAYDNYNVNSAIYDVMTAHFSPNPALRATKGQCITNFRNITTPVLLMHCTGDPVVSITHPRMLRDSLESIGKKVKLIEFNASSHDFDIISNGPFTSLGLAAKDSTLAFLEELFSPPSSVERFETGIPGSFSLAQNFPNPFNPSTQIQFSLPRRSHVMLTIFDLLGREVATLVSEELSAGSYSTHWDAAGLPSGVYLYRLHAEGFVQTRMMILMR